MNIVTPLPKFGNLFEKHFMKIESMRKKFRKSLSYLVL